MLAMAPNNSIKTLPFALKQVSMARATLSVLGATQPASFAITQLQVTLRAMVALRRLMRLRHSMMM